MDNFDKTIKELEQCNEIHRKKISMLGESERTYSQMAKNCAAEVRDLENLILSNSIAIAMLKERNKELEGQDAFMAQWTDSVSP